MTFEQQLDSLSSLSEIEQLNKIKYMLENSFNHSSDDAFKNLQYSMNRVSHLVNRYKANNGIQTNSFQGFNAFENFDKTISDSEIYWKHTAQKNKVDCFQQSKSNLLRGLDQFLKNHSINKIQ